MYIFRTPAVVAATLGASLALTPVSAETGEAATDPVPVAFEGGHSLGVAAVRHRITSQSLEYVLTVDADGKVTECELPDGFRYRATEYAMCRPFVQHMTFEPARDASGNAVQGTYTFALDFEMFFDEDGAVAERFRDGRSRERVNERTE